MFYSLLKKWTSGFSLKALTRLILKFFMCVTFVAQNPESGALGGRALTNTLLLKHSAHMDSATATIADVTPAILIDGEIYYNDE